MLGGGLISAGISYEFSALVGRKDGGQRHIIGAFVFISYMLGMIPFIADGILMSGAVGLLAFTYLAVFIIIKQFGFILFLVMACLFSLGYLINIPGGVILILLVALAISACDIGAYFSGRLIGGAKLAPHISPSKTWSGSCGGVLAAVFIILPVNALEIYPVMTLIIGGAVIAVLSQIGDLIESHFKRRLGVKDSSRLIPGHGGFLDRFDGYLTVLPMLVVFVATDLVGLPDIDLNIMSLR
jgi:phosphatidate cytidylyltransferase